MSEIIEKNTKNDFNTHLQGLVDYLRRDAKPLAQLCYELGATSSDIANKLGTSPSRIRKTYPKHKLLKKESSHAE